MKIMKLNNVQFKEYVKEITLQIISEQKRKKGKMVGPYEPEFSSAAIKVPGGSSQNAFYRVYKSKDEPGKWAFITWDQDKDTNLLEDGFESKEAAIKAVKKELKIK
jgi:hypothetical protein